MSYQAPATAIFGHAAVYVDKILRGAQPAELPVEQPTVFDFVVNTKTAQALGLAIPPDVAAQVTEWIQSINAFAPTRVRAQIGPGGRRPWQPHRDT
jgi:putative ABC transport system substrate-binding protein